MNKSVKISEAVMDPYTAIFSGPTSCGKTKLALDLLEDDYKQHFNNIFMLCPTIRWNTTYLKRASLWKDDYVFLINPKDQLFEWIEKL